MWVLRRRIGTLIRCGRDRQFYLVAPTAAGSSFGRSVVDSVPRPDPAVRRGFGRSSLPTTSQFRTTPRDARHGNCLCSGRHSITGARTQELYYPTGQDYRPARNPSLPTSSWPQSRPTVANSCRRDADHTHHAAQHTVSTTASLVNPVMGATLVLIDRSEERRVGKEC